MAISNCFFSATLEIPQEFPTGFGLVKQILTHATAHCLDRFVQYKKTELHEKND